MKLVHHLARRCSSSNRNNSLTSRIELTRIGRSGVVIRTSKQSTYKFIIDFLFRGRIFFLLGKPPFNSIHQRDSCVLFVKRQTVNIIWLVWSLYRNFRIKKNTQLGEVFAAYICCVCVSAYMLPFEIVWVCVRCFEEAKECVCACVCVRVHSVVTI